jgi:type II secretory pathway predicted ATPase ExeA
MANATKIRELRFEHTKLRTRLERLKQEAEHTERIEVRFEQLPSIITGPSDGASDSA